jgi:tRNA threonylcarbamoyladenosine modification (KEOPS) complex Cgi121 subunit
VRESVLLLFEKNSDGKERQQSIIGICGLTGCIVPKDVGNLLDRLKALSNGQQLLAAQIFNSEMIATHLHILVSALYAIRAFDRSRNISNTIGTEILLYASAQRQIVDAIQRIGVKPESSNVAAVAISSRRDLASQTLTIIAKELAGEIDDSVLSISSPTKARTIRTVFGITEEELNSVGIIETDLKSAEWAITKRVLSRISIMAISK